MSKQSFTVDRGFGYANDVVASTLDERLKQVRPRCDNNCRPQT